MEDTFSTDSMEACCPEHHDQEELLKYVGRMEKIFPEKMRELCSMHLAFLLDFSDGKLEDLLADDSESLKKKLTLTPIFKKKDKPCCGPFGGLLTDEGVSVMLPLIAFLRKPENMRKEGLFRKPGNGRKMKCLKEMLQASSGGEINAELYSSHDVACVLKEFLRDLPEPLLTVRHMEAHKQIRNLGTHAVRPEDKERYVHKKLSALQLLMHLLPKPVQRIVRHLLKLLYLVAQEPETKMTSVTLGTIFAPIFFLDRKTAATDVCDIVAQTEPSVAFMIENGLNMFEVPHGLAIDIVTFWKGLEAPSDDDRDLQESTADESQQERPKIRKYLSGRTLTTNVCYIDRQASLSADVASTTQAELESLYAHVNSLPDTPHNLRLKKQLSKGTSTPGSSTKKHYRTKSIGASIKKRLPYLGRSHRKNRNISVLSSGSSTSSDETITAVPPLVDFLTSPSTSRPGTRQARPRVKRTHLDGPLSRPDCTPPKVNCKDVKEAVAEKPASPNENITAPLPQQQQPAPEDIPLSEDTTLSESSDAAILKNFNKTSGLAPAMPFFKTSEKYSSSYSVRVEHSTSSSSSSAPALTKAVSDSVLPHSVHKDNADTKQTSTLDQRVSPTEVFSPHIAPSTSEKEITYLPYRGAGTVILIHTPEKKRPVAQVQHPHRCNNTPGTPIMPRNLNLLQLAQSSALETSI